jgi:hypothetical protein
MTFPERGLVVAVMANISFADTKSIALNIAQAFAEQRRPHAVRPYGAVTTTALHKRPPLRRYACGIVESK